MAFQLSEACVNFIGHGVERAPVKGGPLLVIMSVNAMLQQEPIEIDEHVDG
jgi:hypothetical protein